MSCDKFDLTNQRLKRHVKNGGKHRGVSGFYARAQYARICARVCVHVCARIPPPYFCYKYINI